MSRYICKSIRIQFCFCNLRYNQVIYRTNHFTESNLNQHITFQYLFKKQIATAQTSPCICAISSLAHLSGVKWPIIPLDSCACTLTKYLTSKIIISKPICILVRVYMYKNRRIFIIKNAVFPLIHAIYLFQQDQIFFIRRSRTHLIFFFKNAFMLG